jgi:hypothetical protein
MNISVTLNDHHTRLVTLNTNVIESNILRRAYPDTEFTDLVNYARVSWGPQLKGCFLSASGDRNYALDLSFNQLVLFSFNSFQLHALSLGCSASSPVFARRSPY